MWEYKPLPKFPIPPHKPRRDVRAVGRQAIRAMWERDERLKAYKKLSVKRWGLK